MAQSELEVLTWLFLVYGLAIWLAFLFLLLVLVGSEWELTFGLARVDATVLKRRLGRWWISPAVGSLLSAFLAYATRYAPQVDANAVHSEDEDSSAGTAASAIRSSGGNANNGGSASGAGAAHAGGAASSNSNSNTDNNDNSNSSSSNSKAAGARSCSQQYPHSP